jgi:hypothetical protein
MSLMRQGPDRAVREIHQLRGASVAAVDLFESVIADLSDRERSILAGSLRSWRADLLAARSEDARMRLVADVIQEIRTLTGGGRTAVGR